MIVERVHVCLEKFSFHLRYSLTMRQGRRGNEDLGRYLRSLRTGLGWTLATTAERAGVGPSALSRFESAVRMPSLEQLGSLAKALGTSQAGLLRRAGFLSLPGFEDLLKDPDVDGVLRLILDSATSDQKRQIIVFWATLELSLGYVGRSA